MKLWKYMLVSLLTLCMITQAGFFPAKVQASQEPLAQGLKVWYKFDETSGSIAYDSSGNGLNATLMNGAGWSVMSGQGMGLNLDNGAGQTKHVDVPLAVMQNVPGDFTVSTWIRFKGNSDGSGNVYSRVFDFGYPTSPASANVMLLCAPTLQFQMNAASGITPASAYQPMNAANLDKWMYVTVVRSGSTSTVYVDGISRASGTQTSTTDRTRTDLKFFIGKSTWDQDTAYPNMLVRDFRVYDRALSVTEINELKEATDGSVADAKASLTWDVIKNANTSPDDIRTNLNLITVGSGGTAISWESSNPSVISETGVVTRPPYSEGNAAVKLIATISKGTLSDTVTFDLTVSRSAQNDEAAVAEAKALVTWEAIRNVNATQSAVRTNLNLITVGAEDTTITWASANTSVISTAGVVTRPPATGSDAAVKLTATIGKGTARDIVTFDLTVLKMSDSSADAILWYDFEGVTGTTVPDISGSNRNGIMTGAGAKIGAGKNGYGLSLNAGGENNGCLRLPDGMFSDITDFTVTSWVRLDNYNSWARVFDFGVNSTRYMFFCPYSDSGAMVYAISTGSSGGEEKVSIGTMFGLGEWVHLAVTQKGPTATIYIDGVAVASRNGFSLNPSTAIPTNNSNYIGRSQYSSDPYLRGNIDDFRIYNKALSPSDIVNIVADASDYKIVSVEDVSLTSYLGELPQLPKKVTVTYDGGETGVVAVAWEDITESLMFSGATYSVYGTVGGTEIKARAIVTANSDSVIPHLGVRTVLKTDPRHLAVSTGSSLIVNYSATPQQASLICAIYNENGSLASINYFDELIPAGGFIREPLSITIPDKLEPLKSTVKIFVWDSNFVPLAEAYIHYPELIQKGSMIEDDSVILEPGMFKTMQDDNQVFLLQLNIDRLTSSHYTAAGLTPKAPQYGGWESWDSCGFGIGHFMSAAALMYKKTGNQAYLDKMNYAVSEIGVTQRPSGFIGGINEQRFIDNVFDRPDSFDVNASSLGGIWDAWYGIQKVFKGLIEVYNVTGNEQALQIAINFASWTKTQTDKLNYQQMQRMLFCEYGAMSETLLWLYQITEDSEHLQLAYRFLRNDDFLDSLSEGIDNLTGRHVNEHIPEVQNGAVYYMYTGDEKYKNAAEFFWQTVVDNRLYANGGIGSAEHFPAINIEPLTANNAETCCVFNFLKLTEVIYSWDHDVKYIDYIENGLFNSIYPSQDQDNHEGYGKIYYNGFFPGSYRVFSTRDDSFWCCVLGGMENPARLSKMIYYKEKGNLYVNLYVPSTVTWNETGMVLTQETNFPYENSTKLTVKSGANNAGIKIRVPGWAAGPLTVEVNGQAVVSQPVDGYITITRNWAAGDVIDVTFPMALSLYTARGDGKTVAFKYGPILLASSLGASNPTSRYSTNGGALSTSSQMTIPDLVIDSRNPDDFMYLVDPATLTFRTSAIGRPGLVSVDFVPFFTLNYDRYAAYWKLSTTAEYPLEISKASLVLFPGDKEKLTIVPSDGVTWRSDNPAIATVDADGVVTAVAVGETVITAVRGDKSATCSVRVTDGSPKLSYDFKNISGTTIPDISGNGRNGTLVGGAAGVSGAEGFNGGGVKLTTNRSDYITVPASVLNGLSDATISITVKLTQHPNFTTILCAGTNSNNFFSILDHGDMGVNSDPAGYTGFLGFGVASTLGGTGTYKRILGNPLRDLSLNEWVNIVYAYSSSEGKALVYLNGEVFSETNVNYGPGEMYLGGAGQLRLGSPFIFTGDNGVVGVYGDFKIYDRTLSHDEIYNEYMDAFGIR